jgi:hypothetical protein
VHVEFTGSRIGGIRCAGLGFLPGAGHLRGATTGGHDKASVGDPEWIKLEEFIADTSAAEALADLIYPLT